MRPDDPTRRRHAWRSTTTARRRERCAQACSPVDLEARDGEWHPDADSAPGIRRARVRRARKARECAGSVASGARGNGDPCARHERAGGRHARSCTVSRRAVRRRGRCGYAADRARRDARRALRRRRDRARTTTGAKCAASPRTAARHATPSSVARSSSTRATRPRRRGIAYFLIALWNRGALAGGIVGRTTLLRFTINGKSWPNTERLTYAVGDTVRFRLLNTSAAPHPMHLHGFYFDVNSRGNGTTDSVVRVVGVTPARRHGAARAWPHGDDHVGAGARRQLAVPLSRQLSRAAQRAARRHAVAGRATGAPEEPHARDDGWARDGDRRARPTMRTRSRQCPNRRGDSCDSSCARMSAAPRRRRRTATCCRKGRHRVRRPARCFPARRSCSSAAKPVSITVKNELREATAVHWHGIELESYFDGVAGFSGAGKHIAPAIAPGDSFVARFTPPRSGTFMYHPHADETRQQQAGLSGALLVVDSLSRFDREHDRVAAADACRARSTRRRRRCSSTERRRPTRCGSASGERYRLRIVDVHVFRPSMIVRLLRDSTLVTWRAVAKDGMDLPPDRATTRRAIQQMGNGETYDFES